MGWLVFWIVIGVLAMLGIIVTVGGLRFERDVKKDMRTLVATPRGPDAVIPAELPAPVARYRDLAVRDHPPIRTMRMRHGGTFRMSVDADEKPIAGTQLFTADPPGFVWAARVHAAPGLWFDARDMSVAGEGSMRVLVDSVWPVVDASGPQLDQGAALRLLAEMAWFPTALFDPRYVTWTAIDGDRARATLRVGGREVSAVYEFDPVGLPLRVRAERFDDKGQLRAWGGVFRDYREIAGMRIPFEAEVTWELESGPFTYAHWRLESVDFDPEEPSEAPRVALNPATMAR